MPRGVAARGPAKKAVPKNMAVDRVSVSTGVGPKRTTKEVSVRQIDNGYIVTESTYGPKGYSSRERFEAKPPTVQVAPSKGRR